MGLSTPILCASGLDDRQPAPLISTLFRSAMKSDNSPEHQRPSAEESHPKIFRVIDEVIERLHLWIDEAQIPDDGTALGNVKIATIGRAFNQYRSIVNLLRTNHWEDAYILIRSLFELLLNTEELMRHKEDAERAAQRIIQFSGLQENLRRREMALYHVATRRAGKEVVERVKEGDRKLREHYKEFWHIDKKGRGKWRVSWFNKNVADLCALSSNPLRTHQYKLLYCRGSEFTHSSPTALFASHFLSDQKISFEEFVEISEAVENRELREAAVLSFTFLGEILLLLGDRLPDFDAVWLARKTKEFMNIAVGV